MLVYRFRVTSDEYEGFLREIEIGPNQTFLDFHFILMEVSDLRNCEKSSFFSADRHFRKQEEITLKPEKRQVRRYDDDAGEMVTEHVPLRQMKNVKVKSLIDDPHQKLLYIFQSKEHHIYTLQIELFKILHSDGLKSLPVCIRQTGEIPRPVAVVLPPKPAAEPKPAARPVVKPIVPLPAVIREPEPEKLDGIEEDEAEIAEIEENIHDILEEEAPEVFESVHSATTDDDEFMLGSGEPLEHMDDFEDLDQLDTRHQDYGGYQEQDDY